MAKVSTIVSTAMIVRNHTHVAMKTAGTTSVNFAQGVGFTAMITKSMYVRGSRVPRTSVTVVANLENAGWRSLCTLLLKHIRDMNLHFQNPVSVSILLNERLPDWTIS